MKRWLVVVMVMISLICTGACGETITRGVSYPSNTIYIYKGQNLTQFVTLFPENETWYDINITAPGGIEVYPREATLKINATTRFEYSLFTNLTYYRGELVIRIHENYTNASGNTVERYYILNIALVVGDAYTVKVSTLTTLLHMPVSKNIRVTPLETNYTVPTQVKKTPATFYLPEGYYRFEAEDGSGGVEVYIASSSAITILVSEWLDYLIISLVIAIITVAVVYIIVRRRRYVRQA